MHEGRQFTGAPPVVLRLLQKCLLHLCKREFHPTTTVIRIVVGGTRSLDHKETQ
jgi:hypothetical protein